MGKYNRILKQIEVGKLNLSYKEKELRKSFKEEYRYYFMGMDILMVLFLIFNLGAIVLTNALIVKENPTITFTEANQNYAEVAGLEKSTVEQSKIVLDSLFFKIGNYTLVFGIYIIGRFFSNRESHLLFLMMYVIYIVSIGGIDFFHDFGFFLGRF